ncbi:MAG: dockerin type I repeat-containing protein [Planctomycetota bacterium]
MSKRTFGMGLLVAMGIVMPWAAGLFAQETSSYDGYVGVEVGGNHHEFRGIIDIVTDAGQLQRLVFSAPDVSSALAIHFSDSGTTAYVNMGSGAEVYDFTPFNTVSASDRIIQGTLTRNGLSEQGRVTVKLNTLVPDASAGPSPQGGIGPDVAVSRVGEPGSDYAYYGNSGGIRTYAAATTSCNVGDEVAEWISGSSGRHPLIAANVYRLGADGSFDQIGQSWLKHSFCAVSEPTCGACQPTNCSTLGIGCADTYWATLNGDTDSGPRSQIDPQGVCCPGVGTHVDSPFHATPVSPLWGRIAISDADIANPGASYFVEVHYITHDEDPEDRYNNASWRQINLGFTFITNIGPLHMFESAIEAWKGFAGATVQDIILADEGMFHVGHLVQDNGDGTWHYEYAIHNLNADRSGQGFQLPIPAGVTLTNIEFHDTDSHSGEIYSSTDWGLDQSGGNITWSTESYGANQNANAIRWGTTYSFRFDADAPPGDVDAKLFLFKPGAGTNVTLPVEGPELSCFTFVRGNVNLDGKMNIADAVYIFNYLFGDGPLPTPEESGDVNDDGMIDIGDGQYILNYLFVDGPEPPAPFPLPGCDPTP